MEQRHAASDAVTDPGLATGAVCWLAAICAECGALVEGGTCWNCGTRRSE